MEMVYVNSEETTDSADINSGDENSQVTEAQANVSAFWPSVLDDIKKIKNVDAKNQVLPLARIKKIMKLDEDVKMISAEAPLLFAKAAEIFIHELTLRAWIHTEDNKRRTLQKNDIAMAITKYDQFDFLIDIVPRDEIKPPVKKEPESKTIINSDQVQYYLQLAQQHQQALLGTNTVQQSQPQQQQQQQTTQTIQLQSPQAVTLSQPQQNILVTNTGQPHTMQSIQQHQQQQQQHQQQPQTQQIQLVQQIVTPSGEIQHVPIPLSPSQLNVLRMQMQNGANTPIIIQAPMQTQTMQPQILQMNQTGQTPVYLNTSLNSSHNTVDD